MQDDPIVEEIHEARRKLFADCKWELESLMDRFREREEDDRLRVVSNLRIGTDAATSG